MRPALGIIALIVVAILLTALLSHNTSEPDTVPPPVANSPADRAKAYDQNKQGAIHATLVVANRGEIGLELYPQAAPETVKHFVDLCHKHFYDGTLFHRYEPGFVIQGGDPASKNVKGEDIANLTSQEAGNKYHLGMGGSGSAVPLEVKLPHLANTLGLARSNEPNSGDSQFFINLRDNANLDSGYCAFGRVVSGADIVPKLRQGDRITRLSVP